MRRGGASRAEPSLRASRAAGVARRCVSLAAGAPSGFPFARSTQRRLREAPDPARSPPRPLHVGLAPARRKSCSKILGDGRPQHQSLAPRGRARDRVGSGETCRVAAERAERPSAPVAVASAQARPRVGRPSAPAAAIIEGGGRARGIDERPAVGAARVVLGAGTAFERVGAVLLGPATAEAVDFDAAALAGAGGLGGCVPTGDSARGGAPRGAAGRGCGGAASTAAVSAGAGGDGCEEQCQRGSEEEPRGKHGRGVARRAPYDQPPGLGRPATLGPRGRCRYPCPTR